MPDAVTQVSSLTANRTFVRALLLSAAGLSLIAGAIWLVIYARSSQADVTLPALVTPREHQMALRSLKARDRRTPKRTAVLFWLAERYLESQRPADAIKCFAEIPTDDKEYGRRARFQQGQALLGLHLAVDAEQQFLTVLEIEEADPQLESRFLVSARQQLRHILEVELRFEERHALLQTAVQREQATAYEVIASLFPSQLRWNDSTILELLEEFYAADPSQPVLRTAVGRLYTVQGRLAEARLLLEGVVREHPDDLRAVAALIACLREADETDEMDRRLAALPALSNTDPWLLLLERAANAIRKKQPNVAAEIYEKVIQQNHTSPEAWQGLAQATRLMADTNRREKAIQMLSRLGNIQTLISKGLQKPSDPNSFLDIADLCDQTDLNHAGRILTKYAYKLDPQDPRVHLSLKRFKLN
jgi:predicted Zn-dependent protease